jgi:hypothetical protein
MLVPGQQWRTFWDFSPDRAKSSLPNQYEASVSFQSANGAEHSHSYEIDWNVNVDRQWVTVYGIHDVAKSLREIARQIRGWREFGGKGLRVVVRDGDARDERRHQEYLASLAEQEQLPGPGKEQAGEGQ